MRHLNSRRPRLIRVTNDRYWVPNLNDRTSRVGRNQKLIKTTLTDCFGRGADVLTLPNLIC